MTRFLSSSLVASIISVIWTTITIGRTAAYCPSGCLCDDKPILRAACINLDDVPIQLNPELKVIDLSMNQITHVNYTFAFYNQLQLLNLTQNKIGILGSDNFMYQSELRVLDLSTNALQQLSKDAFRGLSKVKRLLLNDNQIHSIHHRALPGLDSLVELNLANNFITHLPQGTLQSLLNLRVLILENNQLLDVPGQGNFQSLHKLVFLNLRANLIKELRNESFEGLQGLKYLQIAGNDINQVEDSAFASLSSLKWLDISDNNLTMLPSSQMSKLSNLTKLALGGNTFVQLPPVAFPKLFKLQELHLDRLMNLTTMSESALADNPRLQTLSLANNPKLDQLPVRLFHADASRLDVSLQNNAFTTLDVAQLPIDRVNRLRLAGNPFVCNCSLAWLWRLIDAAATTVENGPTPGVTAARTRTTDAEDAIRSGSDNEWTEAFIKDSTVWEWSTAAAAAAATANNKLVVEDMHKITCDLLSTTTTADGKSRARKRFIDLQETDVECATSFLFTVGVVLFLLIVLTTIVFVWLCRKRHLERLIAKHENDRPIDPWPLDHIEKFEIARDMDRLDYEIRQLDFSNRQLPPIQVAQPQFYPHSRNWNTPTIRSSNHYSSSQPPSTTMNHEYQEPILLNPPPDTPPPLPPRPTLPRVHKYDTAVVVVGMGTGTPTRQSPTTTVTTVGRFHRGGGGGGGGSNSASLSPASQAKYSRTLQNPNASAKQFQRRPFHREDFTQQDDHDGDDESNGLEDDS